MKKILFGLGIALAAAGCMGKRGWSQGDRDKLVGSCVEKAKNPAIDEAKLRNYCSCYQQNLEKHYPAITDLSKAGPEDVSRLAEPCLPLMVKLPAGTSG